MSRTQQLTALLGLVYGTVALLAAVLLEIDARGLPFGPRSATTVFLSSPALWMLLLLPPALTAVGWFRAGRRPSRRHLATALEGDGPTRGQLQARVQMLERQRDQAVEASNRKSEFLASCSHELRTPMNAIIGYSEMMQEDIEAGALPAAEDCARVTRAGRNLLDLLNKILDLSKIEVGRMSVLLEPIAVEQLVSDVVETVGPLAARNGNTFTLAIDPAAAWVRGDQLRVRQILVNLLGNAFKFTEQGTIHLQVDIEDREGLPWVCFRVGDTGAGMDPLQLSRIFDRFAQVSKGRDKRAEGTGLGLAISQMLADMMAGRIEVTSTLGQGSTFSLVLPAPDMQPRVPAPSAGGSDRGLDPGPGPGPDASPDAGHDGIDGHAGIDVLWVDDDPRTGPLERQLGKEGWHVRTASTAAQALAMARARTPSLVLLDVHIDNDAGWGLIRDLRALEAGRDIPIVIASVEDDFARAHALGATAYLPKPLDRAEVVSLLRRTARPR